MLNESNERVLARRYESKNASEWNEFVLNAKNGVFLFNRNYMDYHSDRFKDHSLLIYNKERLVALLPASESDKTVSSHAGLTFGGMLLPLRAKLTDVIQYFDSVIAYYRKNDFTELVYKQIPSFYFQFPSFEDEFALFKCHARLVRRDTSFVVPIKSHGPFQERRLRSKKKAVAAGVKIRESNDLSEYWERVLTPNLRERFGVDPVHTLTEIQSLKDAFPQQIRLFDCVLNGECIAGVLVFVNGRVVHSQYISANAVGKALGALDFLFIEMIEEKFADLDYFSFGTANYKDGTLMPGLTEWKEGFASTVFPNSIFSINLSEG